MSRPDHGLVTADDVCTAVRTVLQAHVPPWAAVLGLPEHTGRWVMLPELDADAGEGTPYGVITSPGLGELPTLDFRTGRQDMTWRVAVAVVDRGHDHDSTASATRRWAAAVRAALVRGDPTLGGLASGLRFLVETYGARPAKDQARTLGSCVVTIDVDVDDVLPTGLPAGAGGPPPDPTVQRTRATVSVRRPTPTTPE